MKMNFRASMRASAALALLFLAGETVCAQGTVFSYQGKLDVQGNPGNGLYDMTFTLFAGSSGGGPIAGPVTNVAVAVSNGLFTTLIDFGPNEFAHGGNWLALAVQTNGGGGFAALTPRQ